MTVSYQTVTQLIQVVATAVGARQDACRGEGFTEESARALYAYAKAHDLAHLLFPLLQSDSHPALTAVKKDMEKAVWQAHFRAEQQSYEREKLYEILETAGLPYLPLKGSVVRSLYPEAWMRTGGDIDILVPKEHWETALAHLLEAGYQSDSKDSHDISLYAPSGVHVELHFSLTDPFADTRDALLDRVWEYALRQDETSMCYELPDELFYYYHIAHMANHIKKEGGCGIRPFLDVWMLWHRCDGNREARERLLREGGLLPFGQAAERLSEVWFSEAEHTELTRELERYIAAGGIQGDLSQRILIQRTKQRRGKLGYVLCRVFPNREQMRVQYPVLQFHPWLLPVCWVRRWCRICFGGRWKKARSEWKQNQQISQAELSRVERLLADLEL